MEKKVQIAVFISGGGSNLQALIDATKMGLLSGEIALVVSSKKKAYGLERAKKENVDTFVFNNKNYSNPSDASDVIMNKLKEKKISYIALAGYLSLLPDEVVKTYKNRIVNIHNALLPKYGGKGMYGHYVHDAVIANKEKESGPTVHLVDEIYDNGKILEQIKIPVLESDTPETLAQRVLEQEHKLYPRVLDKLIKGKYGLNNG